MSETSNPSAMRRELTFSCMADILDDVQPFSPETISSVSLWTPAQIVQHVEYSIAYSMDGFPFRAPWFMRIFGRLIRERVLRNRLQAGFSLPKNMRAVIPAATVSWGEAKQNLQDKFNFITATRIPISLDRN